MSESFPVTSMMQTLSPQTYDQNVDGLPVDMVASDGRAFAVLLLGPFGGGTTLAAKLQESSDQITFVDVPNGAFATFATGSNTHLLGFTRTRRYVRMRMDISGIADVCAAIGQQPPASIPPPVNFVANLVTARDNISSIILAQTNAWIADGCPPTYSVDGESYSWDSWLDGKAAAVDTLSKTIQNNATPFTARSRVRA